MIPFFCVHYGMFTLVHGIFILVFFGGYAQQGSIMPGVKDIFGLIGSLQIGGAVLALNTQSHHLICYDYIGSGEYKQASLPELMTQPYGRSHSASDDYDRRLLMMALGSPAVGLVFFNCIETFVRYQESLKTTYRLRFPKKPILS